MCPYLLWQLCVAGLCGGEDEDGSEGGHVLEQGEEGALHSVTDHLPPIKDVRHKHHTGHAPTSLAEHLDTETHFNKTHRQPGRVNISARNMSVCVCVLCVL